MKAAEEEEEAQVKWTLSPVRGYPHLMLQKKTRFICPKSFLREDFCAVLGGAANFLHFKK